MYKTSAEYVREHRPSITKYSQYKGPLKNTITQIKEKYHPQHTQTTQMTWKISKYSNMVDPKIWGPSFWFTLHNGAATYPIKANKIYSSAFSEINIIQTSLQSMKKSLKSN